MSEKSKNYIGCLFVTHSRYHCQLGGVALPGGRHQMFDILFIKLHTQSTSVGGVPVPVGGAVADWLEASKASVAHKRQRLPEGDSKQSAILKSGKLSIQEDPPRSQLKTLQLLCVLTWRRKWFATWDSRQAVTYRKVNAGFYRRKLQHSWFLPFSSVNK